MFGKSKKDDNFKGNGRKGRRGYTRNSDCAIGIESDTTVYPSTPAARRRLNSVVNQRHERSR
jgi:hypothetical protein